MNLAKLHVGDSGDDVVRLHEALRRHGFAVPIEEAKRKFFGPATREAVSDCQKRHGLEVTGEVDEATAAVLEQEHSVSETGRIGSRALRYGSLDNETTRLLVEKTQGRLSPEGLADSHTFGSQGEEVRQLHKVLHTLGYPIPPTEVQGSIFGEGTQEVVRQFQERNGLKPSGVMDGRTEQILHLRSEIRRPRMVRGRVLQPDGRPLAGAKIQLLEKRLKDEPLVDEGKTESDGSFLFTYSAEERDIDDPGRLALRIAVLDGTIAQPVKSEVLYGPGVEETIDVRLPGDQKMPPEWELICASLQPFLEHVDPANLNEEGVAYLAHVSGLDRPQVATYVESAQFARAQNLPEELAFVLGREGQVASKEQLLETTQAQILAAVDSAMAAKSIDEETARRLRAFTTETLAERQVDHILQGNAGEGLPTLGDLLGTIPPTFQLEAETSRRFARLAVEKGVEADDLWQRAQAQLPEKDLGTLRVTLALRDLALSHLPMMEALHKRREGEQDATLAYLTALKPADWLELAYTVGAPPASPLSPGKYAQQIEKNIESRYPTRVFGERLHQGVLELENFPTGEVTRFLGEHPDFEFGSVQVEPYLQDQGIDDKALLSALMKTQRAQALTGDWRETGILLNRVFDSPSRIVRYGEVQFQELVGDEIPPARARDIYAAAQERSLMALAVAGSYSSHFNSVELAVLPGAQPGEAVLGKYPSLRTLFGDLDYCECRHCRSVLSPAAYLADLLQFLHSSPLASGGTALDVLMKRRPDLAELELSCENTNTEIPYIDLVLELLENAVALPLDVILPVSLDIPAAFGKGTVPEPVVKALGRTSTVIGSPLRVEVVKAQKKALTGPTDWTIQDGSRRWWVRHWKRQLYRGLGADRGREVPVFLQDLDEAVLALRGGTLDAQLLGYLAPESRLSLSSVPTVSKANAAPGGEAWRVLYERAAVIRIIISRPMGTVELLSLDGLSLSIEQKPPVYLLHLAIDLKASIGGGLNRDAVQLLGLPMLDYRVTWDAQNNWWVVRFSGDVTFSLQPEPLSILALAIQNSALDKDLLAFPENRNPEAYERLADVMYPWSLPFSLWLEEVRAVLEHLGVSRQRLMELSRPQSRWTDDELAHEVLGLSQEEAKIIAPERPHAEGWNFWGLQEKNNLLLDHASEVTLDGTWLQILGHVSMVLQQSGLSYRELLNLLQTGYVQAVEPQLTISPSFECKPSQMTFVNLGPSHLDRLHRFTRLWRRLGWSSADLDWAILAFGSGNPTEITPTTLLALSLVQRLHRQLNLPVRVLVSWFAGLDTRNFVDHTREGLPEAPSLYATTFLRPALHLPPDTDFDLDSTGEQLHYLSQPAANPKKLTEKAVLIGAALLIKPSDVALLVDPSSGTGIADELRLEELSSVFRVASLARALEVSIEEYLRLGKLLGRDPFNPQAPVLTGVIRIISVLSFLESVEFIRQSGFNLDELDYLLRHKTRAGTPFARIEQEEARLLEELRSALQHGEVLGEISAENAARQLQRLGWYPELISSVLGPEGLASVPQVVIQIPAINPVPQIPADLQDTFYYQPPGTAASNASLGCLGLATEQDFTRLTNVVPADAVTLLKDTYRESLKKHAEVLQKGMQSFELPVFRESANLPAPKPPIPDQFRSRLRFDADAQALAWIGWMSAGERNELRTSLPAFQVQVDKLFQKAQAYTEPAGDNAFVSKAEAEALLKKPDQNERYRQLLLRLLSRLEKDAAIAQLSAFLGMDAGTVEALSAYLKDAAGNRTALQVLTDEAFVNSARPITPDPAGFPEQFAALIRLGKSALLIQRLRLRLEDLPWLTSGQFKILDPQQLPIAEPALSLFESWQQLVQFVRLRDILPDGSKTLDRLREKIADAQADEKDAHELLAVALELPKTELAAAAGMKHLNLNWRDDYRLSRRLLELAELLHVLKLLGISVQEAESLTRPDPDLEGALEARRLLQTHFDAESLSQRIQQVTDKLRERQREALIAFLISRRGLPDADALFDDLLIDVQMDACMRTSRIKQAISAVQLFVQRCLMNQESDVQPSRIEAAHWQWMEHYRVWEANRKVFLYPEDWIEPELRDDKSEIFRLLESDVLQSELDHERAVEAFHRYLERLEEISHLTVASMFEEVRRDPLNPQRDKVVMHIVARDGEKPYRYFYRKWQTAKSGAARWTPWEEITLQMSSDHPLVFVRRGRIYLAWPTINKADQGSKDSYSWQVGLSLGRRTSSGWTSLKTSRETFSHPVQPGKHERNTFAFRVTTSSTIATIECYGAFDDPKSNPYKIKPQGDGEAPGSDTPPELNVRVPVSGRVMAKHTYSGGDDYYFPVVGASVRVSLLFLVNNTPAPPVMVGTSNTDDDGRFYIEPSLPKAKDLQPFSALSVELDVDYDTNTFKPVTVQSKIPLARGQNDYFQSKHAVRYFELAFTQAPDKNTLPVDPNRKLPFYPIGVFNIQVNEEIQAAAHLPKIDPNSVVGTPLPEVPFTDHFASGFREQIRYTPPPDPLYLGLPGKPYADLLSETPGRFFLVRAAGTMNGDLASWAYKSEEVQLWIQESAPGEFRLLSDGYDFTDEVEEYFAQEDVEGALKVGREASPIPISGLATVYLDPRFTSSTARAIDYDLWLPSAGYNWEVFFHIPLLIATQFSKDMRFAEAERWFHLIFDPTTNEQGDEAVRSWRFLPFRQAGRGKPVEDLLMLLAKAAGGGILTDEEARLRDEVRSQIEEWKDHPFQPHAIARGRIRAYQFAVFLKYLENLIAWADQLFRQDTIESINQATRLYVRAARLLGKRPTSIPEQSPLQAQTYRSLEGRWDDFSNAWLSLEGVIGPMYKSSPWLKGHGIVGLSGTSELDRKSLQLVAQLHSLGTLYFCVPHNEKLLEYWDTLEDRLFKIRHCMNIEGIERQLPLFEPPIDPALLVRAAAAGVDLSKALADLNAPLPHYRFTFMLQKALELVGEVKALGASLLSALEKGDAEALALLRSTQEIELLKKVQDVREGQEKEAKANLQALQATRHLALERYQHYQMLLGKPSVADPPEGKPISLEDTMLTLAPPETLAGDERGLGLLLTEQDQLAWLNAAHRYGWFSGIQSSMASILHLIPDTQSGPLFFQIKWGGTNLGHAANAQASLASTLSANANHFANRASMLSSFQRRRDEWVLQSNLAGKELEQIDKQIAAAQIRIEVAKYELASHAKQLENARKMDEAMRQKYTNQQLYQWMAGQIFGVYSRVYGLAFETAKRVERAYRFELGLTESSFIRYDYWDRMKKGLLAGDQLYYDLKRMEIAYLEQNKREYEITRHVSLVSLNPEALFQLKQTGLCEVNLPEVLFDLDFPGHYMRRMKSVSISIPCVTGPYTGVNSTLTLLKSSVRHGKNLRNGQYARDTQNDDSRFTDSFGSIQSIAVSSGQNDSGLFETNLRDERYLPFEGAGAISTWRLELPTEFRSFDYDTISDVILHMRYTAREGGELLKQRAREELQVALKELIRGANQKGLVRAFSLRHEFPTEWYRFMTTADANGDHIQAFALTKNRFPFLFHGRAITIKQVDLFGMPKEDEKVSTLPALFSPGQQSVQFKEGAAVGRLLHRVSDPLEIDVVDIHVDLDKAKATWELKVLQNDVEPVLKPLEDVHIICTYTVK